MFIPSGNPAWCRRVRTHRPVIGKILFEGIIGGQVGLHPALLILCLLVFGYFMGFVGLLIAVPATALIIEFVKEWNAGRKLNRTTPSG